ncbi:conserved hypothetical protein [Hyella patelloides LEGE 07179]|uniref:CobQ/CobB/MinD/ParA nucleotide binding domain-containing protein n=1 Tax=Hyella patelloides LEGE 07179 TaxID=945734 RepID=A0A563VJT2_9CYAN|nr:hypothetical protein [Hyella patelloides]VEP11587.1 conserved hypothetical protein [Hyella patelloides LEGE 07179]
MIPPNVKRFLISFEEHKLFAATIFLFCLVVSIVLCTLQPKSTIQKTKFIAKGQLSYNKPSVLSASTKEQLRQQDMLVNVDFLLASPVQKKIRNQLQLTNHQLKEIITRQLKINFLENGSTQIVDLEYVNAANPEEAITTLRVIMAEIIEQSSLISTSRSYEIAFTPIVLEVPSTNLEATNRFLLLSTGAGIGYLLAVGGIFIWALLDDRLHTFQEIQELFLNREVPVLGNVPRIDDFDLHSQKLPMIIDNNSGCATFYAQICHNLSRNSSSAIKVILVASIIDREGKSVTAYNLAIAYARAGKRTLVIETDSYSLPDSEWTQAQADENASREPLQYFIESDRVIRFLPEIPNLYLGNNSGSYSELERAIKHYRNCFDLVIIDTLSLSECQDILSMESLADGVVLVTQPGISRGAILGETIDRLMETEIPFLGAVINNTEETFSIA